MRRQLDRGASFKATDADGATPLPTPLHDSACSLQNAKLVEVLIKPQSALSPSVCQGATILVSGVSELQRKVNETMFSDMEVRSAAADAWV